MFDFLKSIGRTELFLFQLLIYGILWLSNEYMASLVTFIIVPIMFAIMVISLIADMIEKSRVPKLYYHFLIISIISPLVVYAFFMWAYEGVLDWIE